MAQGVKILLDAVLFGEILDAADLPAGVFNLMSGGASGPREWREHP